MGYQSKTAPAIDPDDDEADGGRPLQRIVPAASQPMPKTTGLASVFGAPLKKRRTLPPPLDVSAVVVRMDVPIPPALRSKPGVHRYQQLFDRMPAGSMVELPERNATAFMSWAKSTNRQGQLARRKLSDGLAGVWRVTPEAAPSKKKA